MTERTILTHIPFALADVKAERARQDQKWGEQNHPDGTGNPGDAHRATLAKAYTDMAARNGRVTWRDILNEEVAEAFAESDTAALRTELVQVAAVATQWVQAIDRRTTSPDGGADRG